MLSNLSQANLGPGAGYSINNTSNFNVEHVSFVGSSFVVGPIAGNLWDLDSVTLNMNDAEPGTTGAFSVGVYTNKTSGVPDARPGTLVGTLSGSTSPTTAGNYVYTATPGSIQLTAGSTYWLVAGAPSTGGNQSYWWNLTDGTNYNTQASGWGVDTANAIAQFDGAYASDATTWHDFTGGDGNDNVVWRTNSGSGTAPTIGDSFLQFSLSASQASGVPEPSRTMLLFGGLLGLGLRRKRALAC